MAVIQRGAVEWTKQLCGCRKYDTAERQEMDKSACANFIVTMLDFLKRTLPVVSIRSFFQASVPIDTNLEMASKGIASIFLDHRGRESSSGGIRERVDAAIAADTEFQQRLRAKKAPDCNYISNIAHFGYILGKNTAVAEQRSNERMRLGLIPIWEFLEVMKTEEEVGDSSLFDQCVEQVAAHITATQHMANIWEFLDPEQKELCEKSGYSANTFDIAEGRDMFATVRGCLSNPLIYCANVANLRSLSRMFSSIVKIDRLPLRNSFESTLVLQTAWCVVDVCRLSAHRFKLIAHTLFFTTLGLSILAATFTVLRDEVNDVLGNEASSHQLLFLISTLAVFTAGLNAFYKPQNRWKQLRHAEQYLTSEIYRFRTRTGQYTLPTIASGYDRTADTKLCSVVTQVRSTVLQGADLVETDFLKNYRRNPHIFRHGQFAPAARAGRNKVGPTEMEDSSTSDEEARVGLSNMLDDFHSPLRPEQYIQRRIKPRIDFLQQRLPWYYRKRTFGQYFILSVSLLTSVFSYRQEQVDLLPYVPILVAVSAGATAIIEYMATGTKLTRYSEGIIGLNNLLLWWDSISDVEKANVSSINHLVETTENLILLEVSAWAATNASNNEKAEQKNNETDPNRTLGIMAQL